jgi:hypothetical protein
LGRSATGKKINVSVNNTKFETFRNVIIPFVSYALLNLTSYSLIVYHVFFFNIYLWLSCHCKEIDGVQRNDKFEAFHKDENMYSFIILSINEVNHV